MRLAISNIAWPSGEDDRAAGLMTDLGADGVELAPTKLWPRPLEADPSEVLACRRWWEGRGFPVVALQALLFGRPELSIFGPEPTRRSTIDTLKGMNALAASLGAGALVFGSPKNRLVGEMPREQALAIAVDAFREIGDDAASRGVWFCIEPNPTQYGCDFVTTAAEGIELVRLVASEGFGLHLDSGGMTLAGDPIDATFDAGSDLIRHLHCSEPMLAPIGTGGADHPGFSRASRGVGYDRWVSIEMRTPDPADSWPDAVSRALETARECYPPSPDRRSVA
jgi:sugar phosphate isomerase/epimerase